MLWTLPKLSHKSCLSPKAIPVCALPGEFPETGEPPKARVGEGAREVPGLLGDRRPHERSHETERAASLAMHQFGMNHNQKGLRTLYFNLKKQCLANLRPRIRAVKEFCEKRPGYTESLAGSWIFLPSSQTGKKGAFPERMSSCPKARLFVI